MDYLINGLGKLASSLRGKETKQSKTGFPTFFCNAKTKSRLSVGLLMNIHKVIYLLSWVWENDF